MQVDEVTELAEEGIKTVSGIEDPAYKLLTIFMLVVIIGLAVMSYKLFHLKIKDVEQEKDNVKKKDELLENNKSEFVELLKANISVNAEVGKNVDRLTAVIEKLSDKQQINQNEMIGQINKDHDYFKKEINKIQVFIAKSDRTA